MPGRNAFALTLSFAILAGCAVEETAVGPGGGGGKADDLRECPDGMESCLQYLDYEVRFTDPLCELYEYDAEIERAGGQGTLTAKPKNVFCTKDDAAVSAARESSPEYRLLDWIGDVGAGDELFLAYLSFSNERVADALCAAEERGAEVTFVLDKWSSRAQQLQDCGGTVLLRGHLGSIGFQHNKLLMVNPHGPAPDDPRPNLVRISFGSANMSSGTVLHHENWHFIEVARQSYFAATHACLVDALLDETSTDGKGAFRDALAACRGEIEFPEEEDIRAFFIPSVDDRRAVADVTAAWLDGAAKVDIAAHRFSWNLLVDGLVARFEEPDGRIEARLVMDDDVYWLRPLVGEGAEVGLNNDHEADIIDELRTAGGERFAARFMETNHPQYLLHHNKFVVFRDDEGAPRAVLCGAANFTNAGYRDNLENVYFVTVPHVVDAFAHQFDRFWGDTALTESDPEPPRATAPEDMPIRNEMP